ncbi:UNVERIFIED_CONTAM: type II toxin-antitoxin system RelE/ParE family toxin, partial [Pseudomonas aeruginosa]
MIISFRHKGLEVFFKTGKTKGIQAAHAQRLRRQLLALSEANNPGDMNQVGWRLHSLKGDLAGYWSVRVSGNWRLTFRFVGEDVELVDYQDY